MNISPINDYQTNTNFGALKSLKFVGEFKNSPFAQEKVLDALESNTAFQRFRKNLDVDIIIEAINSFENVFESCMAISYRELDNGPKTLLKKVKDFFKGNEVLEITGYKKAKKDKLVPVSIEESAAILNKKILESSERFETELLNLEARQAKIYNANERIDRANRLKQFAEQKKAKTEKMNKIKQLEIDARIASMIE